MALIDKETIRKEIQRLEQNILSKVHHYPIHRIELLNDLLAFLDSLPEQPVEYPTSTEMIAEWENNELPMLREKDFRGDAERMAYNAFMDGFAKGLGYRK